jgi:hypothetical protein
MTYETQWCANCGAGHRSMKRFDGEGMLCRGCFQYFARIEQHEAAQHLDQTELDFLEHECFAGSLKQARESLI